MTHSIHKPRADETLPYFQRLWRILFAPNVDPRTRLERLFEHELDELDLTNAFLSHIDLENETERFEISVGSHDLMKPGTTVPLSKTYCRKTIAHPEGTMAVSDAIADGWEDDPAYETFELGSYVGTTVTVDDELYGTLCYADTDPRADPFVDAEKAVIEMHAQWVASTLAGWDGPMHRGPRPGTIEAHHLSSSAIDTMMDALRRRTRRLVLTALLDRDEITVDALDQQLTHEHARIRLIHSHLPRLANAGYAEWDEATDTISRGSKFAEVEPLVRLLQEYNRALPE